ncbi:MAG: DUF1846 family protein [Candidatus Saccharibacteria bacterium]|nr:DUF1846 family protein [Candidatus Saccharibacteria bacterium]
MAKNGFDADLYLQLQTTEIMKRVKQFDKLYLEVGGKIVDDLHAARVLPGFDAGAKIKVLQQLREQIEIIVCVSARDLISGKVRGDAGISYTEETLRIVRFFRKNDFLVNNLIITLCDQKNVVQKFIKLFEQDQLEVSIHSRTDGYPNNVDRVVSQNGYGKNSFIKTKRPIVIVTAPGPSSGKMATCLSQIYHEFLHGKRAGYAKYETFPVWNLPLNHPVNLAYEAATLDLADENMIDPYHLTKYGIEAVNYNRDIETFPVLREIFTKIYGHEIYSSPTDMGVNMVASGIIDDEIVMSAARQEIVRRYYKTRMDYALGKIDTLAVERAIRLFKKTNLRLNDSIVTQICQDYKNDLDKRSLEYLKFGSVVDVSL